MSDEKRDQATGSVDLLAALQASVDRATAERIERQKVTRSAAPASRVEALTEAPEDWRPGSRDGARRGRAVTGGPTTDHPLPESMARQIEAANREAAGIDDGDPNAKAHAYIRALERQVEASQQKLAAHRAWLVEAIRREQGNQNTTIRLALESALRALNGDDLPEIARRTWKIETPEPEDEEAPSE